MKKIRLFFFASIVICFAAALAACGKQTLSQPGGLTIDETTLDLTWNEVEDARRYVISINGEETEIRQNLYDLEYLEPGNYEIKIKAVNERDGFADSKWSETIDFTRETESGLFYRLINDDTAYEVSGVGSVSGDVVIEDSYRGKPVVSIGKSAFSRSRDITGITIGKNVTNIGENAFANCLNLTAVTMSESVVSIGAKAFQSCSSLAEIQLPSGLAKIESYTFSYCRSLTDITIPDSVEEIGSYAFSDCSGLESITIPDSVTSMGEYAINSERDFRKTQQKISNNIENSLQMIA